MKKLLLMCCFLVGITAVSRAQGGGGRRSPEDQAKNLQTQLKLNDDQTAKVTAIYKTQATKRDSIRTAANGDRETMMKGMMPLMMSTNTQIKAILTPEQATAYDAMVKERMDRLRQGGGGGGGGNNQ